VSECSRLGVPEGELRDWLGHKSSEMVEYYRHLRVNETFQRMQALSFFDGPSAKS
jgi:hypothetical protein